MSDRLPGSGPSNPMQYKDFCLCIHDPETLGEEWEFWNRADSIYEYARSEQDAKQKIDAIINKRIAQSYMP